MFFGAFSGQQKESTLPTTPRRFLGWSKWLLGGLLLSWCLGACGPTDTVMWESKNREKRVSWMGTEVYPAMKVLFEEFDPARYKGKFTCETCHGKDYTSVDYKMPHTVFPMDPKNPITENDSDPILAKYAKFMKEKVMPEMKKLMGKNDITCNYCHASK